MSSYTRMMALTMGAVVALGGAAAFAQPKETAPKTSAPATQPAKADQPAGKDDKKAETPAKEQYVYVQLQTSMGDILLELNQSKAPLSVDNFLSYMNKGHYNGTIFHRVIKGFMVQGGGFDASMKQKEATATVKNEWTNGLKNQKYTVAMARLTSPDSASAQFFINVADNDFLDRASPRTGNAGYAVFGKVVAGFDVVDKIATTPTTMKGQMPDVPAETVTINTAKKLTDDEAAKIKNGGKSTEKKPETAKPDAGKPADKK